MNDKTPRIPLPKSWPPRVKSAMLHVISLAQFATAYTRGWAANSVNARIRLKARVDQLEQIVAMLGEEIRIKDSRMASTHDLFLTNRACPHLRQPGFHLFQCRPHERPLAIPFDCVVVYKVDRLSRSLLDLFDAVQICMKRRAQTNTKNKYGALLGGLLRCSACGCTMSHAYSKKPNRRYRYYVCNRAQKLGWDNCPSPLVPANEIEQFVVGEIKAIGRDEELASRVLDEVRRQLDEESGLLKAEADRLKRQLRRDEEEVLNVTAMGTGDAKHLADLQDRIRVAKERLIDVRRERRSSLSENEVLQSLAEFDPVWESLSPGKQVQLIRLLISQVEFDGVAESVAIRFHATGLKAVEEAVA